MYLEIADTKPKKKFRRAVLFTFYIRGMRLFPSRGPIRGPRREARRRELGYRGMHGNQQ